MPACHAGGHGFESRSHRNPDSDTPQKNAAETLWCVSSAWLECLPVTQEVTGSSPVRTAKAVLYKRMAFLFSLIKWPLPGQTRQRILVSLLHASVTRHTKYCRWLVGRAVFNPKSVIAKVGHCQSASSSWNTSSSFFPNTDDIFSDRTVEGTYFPASMAFMVWRVTPVFSASCCCVMRFMARSTLMLFFIPSPP